jgi:hypothetical protein
MIHQSYENSNHNKQLKFNLNAVVDNLNLVNVCHNPKPIIIQNNFTHGKISRDMSNNIENKTKSSFEFIDEEKMSMYSFLIKRDIQTKEWLSKFELDQQNKQEAKLNESILSIKTVTNSTARKMSTDSLNKKQKFSNQETANSKNANTKNTNSNFSKPSAQINKAFTSELTNLDDNDLVPTKLPSALTKSAPSGLNEINKCGEDSIKSIEFLIKQLDECN